MAACDACGEGGASLKLCTRCRDRSYCSVACQRDDWSEHKKTCRPNYRREVYAAVDRAIEDEALAPHEIKTLKLSLKRIEGNVYNHEIPDNGSLLRGMNPQDARNATIDCNFMFAFMQLFGIDRGVTVSGKKNSDPPQIGFIIENGSENSSNCVDNDKLMRNWKKKMPLKIGVQLVDEEGREGEVVTVEPHSLRMLPIRDKRHVKYSMSVEESIPAGVDPDEFVFEGDSLPEGVSWQYLDEEGEWKDYKHALACRIESLYNGNSPHYLYTPGNPHTSGSYAPLAARGEGVGQSLMSFYHCLSTRQIIFEVSSLGCWVSGPHDQTDNFTERDFFTGMQRRVRRVGGTPRAGGDGDGHKNQTRHMFQSGIVNWLDTREKCGLCGNINGPFITTECCGATVCDTEGQYRLNSYEREGQCARNHRLHSICSHHKSNGHDGDWKSCQKCEDDFHPYDYAVKATSRAVSGTIRRYNFDDNVRTDIHPADVAFPTCSECGVYVNTTEESLHTLCMRKSMGGNKVLCSNCGGGFGKVKPQW